MNGRLYIRSLVIVDDTDEVIFKTFDTPIKVGLKKALDIVEKKDSRKTVRQILNNFVNYLDEDFKILFNMEEQNGKSK